MSAEEAKGDSEAGPSADKGAAGDGYEAKSNDSIFECNICLDTAKDAVISMCGHLFCWPCLHQWLETRPNRQTCPVCKSAVSRDKVIPLYGRGGDGKDPRAKAPPRPQGQRTEPTYSGFPGFNWGGPGAAWGDNQAGGGLQFSFGIGAFPFTMFASTMNFGEQRPHGAQAGTAEYQAEQSMSRIFLWLALVFIVWLMLA